MAAVLRIPLALLLLTPTLAAQSLDAEQRAQAERRVIAAYAHRAHAMYAEAVKRAESLRKTIHAFVKAPSKAGLLAARRSWSQARRAYVPTEVFRFYGGPIDGPKTGVELWVNMWPVDESFIDGVRGKPEAGIIQSPERYPLFTPDLLMLWNEGGGETHVSTGWHAIEFLLWGQDFNAEGPGDRRYSDYVAGKAKYAKRRGDYLRIVADLLVTHLCQVRDDWAPGRANFRARFLAEPTPKAIRRILTGIVVLSGFEMSGERLAVAYETRDQEDEHSCFSDTTHLDLRDNQRGIERVWRGTEGPGGLAGLGVLVRAVDPALAREIDGVLAASRRCVEAIPAPFDRAIRGGDSSAGRKAVLAAIEALERQTMALAGLGPVLGFRVPLRPGN